MSLSAHEVVFDWKLFESHENIFRAFAKTKTKWNLHVMFFLVSSEIILQVNWRLDLIYILLFFFILSITKSNCAYERLMIFWQRTQKGSTYGHFKENIFLAINTHEKLCPIITMFILFIGFFLPVEALFMHIWNNYGEFSSVI